MGRYTPRHARRVAPPTPTTARDVTPARSHAAPHESGRRAAAGIVALAVTGAVALSGGAGFVSDAVGASGTRPSPHAADAPPGDAASRAVAASAEEPAPAFLELPSIGVTATVIDLGLNLDGTLEVPADFNQAGWFTGSARPGATGPMVIAGHLDSYKGPAVFARLTDLEPGDRVRVARTDGTTVSYEVRRIDRYPKEYFPTDQVYGRTEQPELRLITCGGTFDEKTHSYRDNVVVYADLADDAD